MNCGNLEIVAYHQLFYMVYEINANLFWKFRLLYHCKRNGEIGNAYLTTESTVAQLFWFPINKVDGA